MVKTSLSLAAAMAVIGLATHAFAIMQQQGVEPNGVNMQGIELQGWSLNGVNMQGITLQGTDANSATLQGIRPAVERVILATGETVDLR